MFVVMHCGGIPFNGDTIKTKSLGGSESAAYYVAKELAAKGHSVTLFTNSQDTGIFDGVKYEWEGNISDDAPLGDRFTYYAENTPHDLCIVQRHPRAFERKLASKLNFLWLHDIALYRNKQAFLSQMWNVDQVLVVSEYHKQQVCKVYGIPESIVSVVKNGVDLELYDNAKPKKDMPKGVTNLFYSSRPERGLEELVKVGGIMEQLQGKPYFLHVCGYDNTVPQMKEYYEALWERCNVLPNVFLHGALNKPQLAALQKACDVWVYPTAFEEVSCITAMEAMAAGCEIVASKHAAIPETCADTNALLIPLKNGAVDTAEFVRVIDELILPANTKLYYAEPRHMYAERFTWASVAERILGATDMSFGKAKMTSLAHHFIRHSDIKAFEALKMQPDNTMLRANLLTEFGIGYKFYRDDTYAQHYASYYEYEKNRGVNYGPEDVSRTTRFQVVASHIRNLPDGAVVLDYGCAHGHYTITLAKMFPNITFRGADITQSNIDKARAWAEQEDLDNVVFVKVEGVNDMWVKKIFDFDAIIAAEVIEHVGNPQYYVDELVSLLKPSGKMIITVPYGPWEAQGYREHGYWRAHLHHFERQDLLEMLGHHPAYKVVAVPSGMSMFYTPLGSYVVTFDRPTEASKEINYERKIYHTMPDQTIACCMIVKDAEADLLRCLRSVAPHVQEFVIGVDATTKDNTMEIAAQFARDNPLVAFRIMTIESPLTQGFAAARNVVIEKASSDWILWLDADEILMNGGVLSRYLRNSMFNGFAVAQHHFSHDPVAVIKVDLPCRIFRNDIGVQFFGHVHEHPEIVMNDGLGAVSTIPQVYIVHNGYVDEGTRRRRFGRNLPLLERDRKENPTRILGKFLWLRDLAQSCQYDAEDGRVDMAVVDQRVKEGIALWHELLDAGNYRLAIDGLMYYSHLVMIGGEGVDVSFTVDASMTEETNSVKTTQVSGYFESVEVAQKLINGLLQEKVKGIERRYL